MAKDPKPEKFEDLYARLEAHVAKLDAGGLPLDETIALYEQGMELARVCHDRLDEAELKITKLRESFAAVPQRTNGATVRDQPQDYEYVAEEAETEPAGEDDVFA